MMILIAVVGLIVGALGAYLIRSTKTETYPKPSVTADTILYRKDKDGRYKVLLIKRKNDPYKDCWAFPGGFLDVNDDNDLKDCGIRELQEETGVTTEMLDNYEQFETFGKMDRDPRDRIITVVFTARANMDKIVIQAADDAKEAMWFSFGALPELAFDHSKILSLFCNSLINQNYE